MSQTVVNKLDSGDLFPEMKLQTADGAALTLPERGAGTWSVLLVYRGRW